MRKNQRERLFAATVACVSKQGFSATTLGELVEVSGVSSRSFYGLFPDKAACLAATVEAILAPLREILGSDFAGDGDLECQIRECYRLFVDAVVAQPAAATVCLIEASIAGPMAVKPVEEAIADSEEALGRLLRSAPERAELAPQIVTARTGGVLAIARSRLRRGAEPELRGLEDAIVALVLADRPPAEALRLSVRPPKARPESLSGPDHADRAIRALAVLAAERGYGEVAIDDVVKTASMSATTFYANFSGKEDLMMAAVDSACAQIVAAVMPAFSRQSEWPVAVRAGFGAMMSFLASRPALAQLIAVEVYAASEEALRRRDDALAPLGVLVRNNIAGHGVPLIVFEALVGGIRRLIYSEMKRAGAQALPGLAPWCTYLALSPFIGPEAACAAANGAGAVRMPRQGAGKRWGTANPLGTVPLHRPVNMALIGNLLVLTESLGPLTAPQLAEASGGDLEEVREQLRHLAAIGALEDIGDTGEERRYRSPNRRHNPGLFGAKQLTMMSTSELREFTRGLWEVMGVDVNRAFEAGTFEARPDLVLLRTPMHIDEQGRRELTNIHERAVDEMIAVQTRSTERLRASGEPGIEVRSLQLAFEMPRPEPEGGEPPNDPKAGFRKRTAPDE